MPESIGRALELDGNLGSARSEEAGTGRRHLLKDLVADDLGKELVHDGPLPVPPHEPAGLLERIDAGQPARLDPLGHGVVEQEEGHLKAGDHHVLVVPRITDDRPIVGVSREILVQAARLHEEADRIADVHLG